MIQQMEDHIKQHRQLERECHEQSLRIQKLETLLKIMLKRYSDGEEMTFSVNEYIEAGRSGTIATAPNVVSLIETTEGEG